MTTSEACFAPVQLIEQHLETRTPKKENASNLAVVPRPNRYEGATQTNPNLILLGPLACLTITSPHLFRNGDWRLEVEEWRYMEHSAALFWGFRGYMKAMADKSCTLRCATNKVHMRAPAREPLHRSCPITRSICILQHHPVCILHSSLFYNSRSNLHPSTATGRSYQTCRKPASRVCQMDPRTHADMKNRDIFSSTALPHVTFPVLGKMDRHQITTSGASVAMCSLDFPVMDSKEIYFYPTNSKRLTWAFEGSSKRSPNIS